MVAQTRLVVSPDALAEFCRRNHIKRLAFLGVVLRDDFRPDSDVDVLYQFEEDHIPGYDFVRIVDELSALLGDRSLNLVSYHFINPRLRDRILAEAEVQYDAG